MRIGQTNFKRNTMLKLKDIIIESPADEDLKAAEKIGKPLFIWGANDRGSIQKLSKDNVAGIMTDRPDLF